MVDNYEYQVGASLPPDAPSYVVRKADSDFYHALKAGKYCYVFNSRQMGKSSLKVRVMQKLVNEGVACTSIDVSGQGSKDNVTQEQWYTGIVSKIVKDLQIAKPIEFRRTWWRDRHDISPVQRLDEFIEDVLLSSISGNIIIFIDEIDSTLSLGFASEDFFALIRSCYNKRAENPAYKRLTFALLGVATPGDLIQDKTRTPFNIGEAIELDGFKIHEIEPLAKGLAGKVANPQAVMQEVLAWTGGQPFLTQRVCELLGKALSIEQRNFRSVGENQIIELVKQIINNQIIDNWEANDKQEHLKTIRDRLLINEEVSVALLGLYQQILQQKEMTADSCFEQMRLRLTGLVVQQQGKLRVYNQIYGNIFDLSWVGNELGKLRPYANKLKAWVESNYQDNFCLLRGKDLEKARIWADGRKLSHADYRFLSASDNLEKREVQKALDAEKTARYLETIESDIAIEVEKKAKQAAEEAVYILANAKQKSKNSWNQQVNFLGIKIVITLCVTCLLFLPQSLWLLQYFELRGLDLFFSLRPIEAPEERITIVAIDEASLRKVGTYPISDGIIADLLTKLQAHQPRAVGLNIYRDLAVEPGHKSLVANYKSMPNLVGAYYFSKDENRKVSPPDELNRLGKVGFNNVVTDNDGVIRRGLLTYEIGDELRESFAFMLAKLYLNTEKIKLQSDINNGYVRWGKAVFHHLNANNRGYVEVDNGGNQILLNFPKIRKFDTISMQDILTKNFPQKLVTNRIVLIGNTAPSLQDYGIIPYSVPLIGNGQAIANVEIQAYFISEILRATLDGRPLLKPCSSGMKFLFILFISWIGASISWRFFSPIKSLLYILMLGICLVFASYLVFLAGWWIPIIPSFMCLVLTATVARLVMYYHLENLQLRQTFELIIEVSEINSAAAQIAIEYLKISESKKNKILIEKWRKKY